MAKQDTTDGLQLLKNAIKSAAPERLYVFWGEEVFLLHHYLEQLKKSVLDELTESFNYHRFTQETFDIRDFCRCGGEFADDGRADSGTGG